MEGQDDYPFWLCAHISYAVWKQINWTEYVKRIKWFSLFEVVANMVPFMCDINLKVNKNIWMVILSRTDSALPKRILGMWKVANEV